MTAYWTLYARAQLARDSSTAASNDVLAHR